MDRRPIIGFVLIFLIIIGYYFVMGQLYPAQPAATTAATMPGAFAGVDSLPNAPLTMAQALMPQPAAGGPEAVTVTTPLYRTRIEMRGGVVTGWELLEHKSWRGGPLQLVPQGGAEAGSMAVVAAAGLSATVSVAVFVAAGWAG